MCVKTILESRLNNVILFKALYLVDQHVEEHTVDLVGYYLIDFKIVSKVKALLEYWGYLLNRIAIKSLTSIILFLLLEIFRSTI
jgi:hypothetical protein